MGVLARRKPTRLLRARRERPRRRTAEKRDKVAPFHVEHGLPSKRRRRAVLSIYVRENEDDDTRASYLRKNLRLRILDYERVTRSFFTISMERDKIVYYSWCNFSVQRAVYCFEPVYPQRGKAGIGDPVVKRISLCLRALER